MIINKKILLSFLLVMLWCSVIFIMSSMNTNESNDKSKSTINMVIETTIDTTNDLGITDKHPNENQMQQIIENLNKPVRKAAHASEFCVLAILIYLCLKNYNLKTYKIALLSILFSFIYACSDEYHQLFVQGRTGQVIDVVIDTCGAIFGVTIVWLICYIKERPNGKKKKIQILS